MFWRSKKTKTNGVAAENAVLKCQLENATQKITALMLERIQLINEIDLLKEYRSSPPQVVVRPVGVVGDTGDVPQPANTQIGHLHTKAVG